MLREGNQIRWWTFNPRFQGIHFVNVNEEEEDVESQGLSIPVFRGFILLGNAAHESDEEKKNFQSPFSGDSFC